jgi:hypothetical protein
MAKAFEQAEKQLREMAQNQEQMQQMKDLLAQCQGLCAGGKKGLGMGQGQGGLGRMGEAELAELFKPEPEGLGGQGGGMGGDMGNGMGGGMGGGGIGRGGVAQIAPDDSTTTPELIKGKIQPGEIVGNYFIDGKQIKGERRVKFREAVQSAEESAPDAIDKQRMPKQYEGYVKNYFEDMRRD